MFKSPSLFVILLAVCPALSLKPYDFVTYVLKQADIIPDIISANPHFHPQAFLFATLPVGPLLLGNTLNKTSSLTPPNISFTPMQAPTHKLYTIVMADPDAPSRDNQSYSAYRHWLVRRSSFLWLDENDLLIILLDDGRKASKEQQSLCRVYTTRCNSLPFSQPSRGQWFSQIQ
jgi:hypothetical protein